MTVVGYAFEEALASLRRSGRSALVSIGTIAIAFITLGGFLLLSVNVQGMLDRWLEAAEMSVYLQDDAPRMRNARRSSRCCARVPKWPPSNTCRRNGRSNASGPTSRSWPT